MVLGKSPLIVCALEDEYRSSRHRVHYTGMGKINALMAMAHVNPQDYDYVINLGSAGSASIPPGTICRAVAFREWDRDIPLGFESRKLYRENPEQIEQLKTPFPHVLCDTGDCFVSEFETGGELPIVYDMEAYALAVWCHTIGKPFLSLKYVSDAGSQEDWRKSLPSIQQRFDYTLEHWVFKEPER